MDRCLIWQGEPVEAIAVEIQEAFGEYGSSQHWPYGDPTGENWESNQESWISNLNHHGVPIEALDPWYNTAYGVRQPLEGFQQLLDCGRLKPRKDRHSHPGDTGRYGAGTIVRLLRRCKPPGGPLDLARLSRPRVSDPPLGRLRYVPPRYC